MSFSKDFVAQYFKEAGRLYLAEDVLTEVAKIYDKFPAIIPVIFRVIRSELDFGANQNRDNNLRIARGAAVDNVVFADMVAKRIKAHDERHRTYIPAVIWSRQGSPISYQTAVSLFEEDRDRKIKYPREAQDIAMPYCLVGNSTVELMPEILTLLQINDSLNNPQNHFSGEFIRTNRKIDQSLLS